MNWSKQVKENGVIYLTAPKKEFERDYTAVRQKENRLLTDELVKTLPFVQYGPHVNEWKKRLDTLERLSPFIRQLDHKTILEVGCGNGWFSKMLVKKNNTVVGLDVGKQELEQAARCFPNENLHFVCSTDLNLLPDFAFDCIVFNASIQYFDTSASWWDMIFKKVKKGGEIHLIDSPFYDKKEVLAAKERSKMYFKQLNEDQAHTYYFHHTWNELPATREILYLPRKWKRLFHKHASPFPWIRIKI